MTTSNKKVAGVSTSQPTFEELANKQSISTPMQSVPKAGQTAAEIIKAWREEQNPTIASLQARAEMVNRQDEAQKAFADRTAAEQKAKAEKEAERARIRAEQDAEALREIEKEEAEKAAIEQATSTEGGWKNVVDVLKIAANPFSNEKIQANVSNPLAKALLEAGANNPYETAGIAAGALTAVRGLMSGFKAATSQTAVQAAKQIGRSTTLQKNTVEHLIETNTVSQKITATWLAKAAKGLKNPSTVVGTLMAALGSYPFAGFLKEEALQTIGFAVNTAYNNNDIEGAEEALKLQRDILNPGLWDEIKSKIPYVNVLNSLDDFYAAATMKMAVDEQLVKDMKVKIENNETDAQYYERVNNARAAEQEAQRQADEEYYSQIQDRLDAAREARRKEDEEYYANLSAKQRAEEEKRRKEEEAYWEKVLADAAKRKAEERAAEAAYWDAYWKEVDKKKMDSAPSNLKFGLL